MVKTIRLNYGVEAQVIANGRNEMEFVPGTKMPLVFAAGRLWDPAKNLGALDTVAEGLRWPVYVAGDRRQPGGEAPVSGSHVHLLGRLAAERVASWLRRASIYAFPARYEPFGLSVLEAALGGCALVLGDIASLRQLWDGAAVFVPPDDTQTLRLALEELIDDAGLRQALAMRARRRALMLTPQRMASSYLQLYSNLLQSEEQIARESACAS
jgi:glycogen(starch) synthase